MVDILLAVYNGEKYLKAQLDSIFEQSYKNFRIIILDDCSTDGSYDIINSYVKRYKDRVIYLKSFVNSKSAKNSFSKLLTYIRADYIAFCDQDDVWHKDKLSSCLQRIRQLESKYNDVAALVYSDLFVVDESLKIKNRSFMKMQHIKGSPKTLQKIIVQNNITGCSVLINKKLAKLCGVIPKEALMHDWWLAIIAIAFGKVAYIDTPLVYYRQHSQNSIGAKDVKNFKYILNKIFDGENIKKNFNLTYNQCEAFLKKYEDMLTEKQKKILTNYIKIKGCSKPKKILQLVRGGYFKYGIMRKFGQIFYI